MRCSFALAGLLVGCGRLQFDAPGDITDAHGDTCVPVGHDDDGDGTDDACDLCPQRPNSGLDSDGDGVGDDCDVSPLAQTRVLFDPSSRFLEELTMEEDDMPFFAEAAAALLSAARPQPRRLTVVLRHRSRAEAVAAIRAAAPDVEVRAANGAG